jgi:hypothetical protein
MRIISAGLLSASLAAGLVGSVVAYRSQAIEDVEEQPSTATASVAAVAAGHEMPRIRWAPCPDGTRLDKKVCVKHVVRTVVIPAAAAPAQAPSATQLGGVDTDDDQQDHVSDGHHGDDGAGDDAHDDGVDDGDDDHQEDPGDDEAQDHADEHEVEDISDKG